MGKNFGTPMETFRLENLFFTSYRASRPFLPTVWRCHLAVGIYRDAMRYSITLGAHHQYHLAAGAQKYAIRCCNFRRALLQVELTGHAHGYSTTIANRHVNNFDRDEAVIYNTTRGR